MLNNIHKKRISGAKIIINFLLGKLKESKLELIQENDLITNDTPETITSDYDFTIEYLTNYLTNHEKELRYNLKQKGDVLIILSYNEPIIMSVVPIMNALIAGNNVYVKPSSKCLRIFNLIWRTTSLPKEFRDRLTTLEIKEHAELEKHIKAMNSVHFFGSEIVAREVYKYCANYFVEFIPEIETADPKVYYKNNPTNNEIYEDCLETLKSSVSHTGQMCERICGVYVHIDNYNAYLDNIKKAYKDITDSKEINNSIKEGFTFNNKAVATLVSDIDEAIPKEIIGEIGKGSVLVVDPLKQAKIVSNGYFYPILWIVPFTSGSEIVNLLRKRRYFLGINLTIDDQELITTIVESTRFTRYTTENNHEKVGTHEGWGGNWPSGSGGYKSWLEHFSVRYVLV